jgi:transcriptional regulator with XRE-family HTH domain
MKHQPPTEVDAFGAESVNLDVPEIGIRMKEARKALSITQDCLAAMAGAPSKSGLQNNEAGKSMPGGRMIGALVRAGINANWLLTGEGPMLLADLQAAQVAGALDRERMRMAIEAIEEALEEGGLVMAPTKKAEVVLAAYDVLETFGVTKEKVMKLVKLAA